MDDKSVSDDELYERYREGDSSAYDALMQRYDDNLLWYLYGMMHDYQEAEDMMIEAFARIMVKRPWIGKGCFKAYLFKTGRNLVIRHLKKASRYDQFSLDGMETELAADENVERDVVKDDKTKILHRCLERVDPTMREALYLIYFDNMSYGEAAEVLKVNLKKIDNLVSRGKQRLKEELEKEGVTDPYA